MCPWACFSTVASDTADFTTADFARRPYSYLSFMMSKRKQLLFSLCAVPALIVLSPLETLAPKPGVLLLTVTALWAWLAPAIFASRYAKELGMPSGSWGLMSFLVPVITPAILLGYSQPSLMALAPDTMIAGRSIRDWDLGEPIKAFNTKKYLGMGGNTLILTSEGFISDANNALMLTANGFFGDRKRIGGVAWSQVKEIYQNLRDQYTNGFHSARIRQYNLVLDGGRKLCIDQRFSDIDELGRHLQLNVTAALRISTATKLEHGEQLTFGPISVTSKGLALKNRDLPWSEVESVGINTGYLVIAKRASSRTDAAMHRSVETVAGVLTRIVGTAQPMLGGGRGILWKKVAARKVPNIYLLIAVAEAMRA